MSWNSDSEEEYLSEKDAKFQQSFRLFEDLDWTMIENMTNAPKCRRFEVAHGHLQTLVFRLTDRRHGKDMSDDEMLMFCKTLQACWKVCPDYHVPLHMMTSFFNEKIALRQLRKMDFDTQQTLMQMAQQTDWPNNQGFPGTQMGGCAIQEAASSILKQVRGESGKVSYDPLLDPMVMGLFGDGGGYGGLGMPLYPPPAASSAKKGKKINANAACRPLGGCPFGGMPRGLFGGSVPSNGMRQEATLGSDGSEEEEAKKPQRPRGHNQPLRPKKAKGQKK